MSRGRAGRPRTGQCRAGRMRTGRGRVRRGWISRMRVDFTSDGLDVCLVELLKLKMPALVVWQRHCGLRQGRTGVLVLDCWSKEEGSPV